MNTSRAPVSSRPGSSRPGSNPTGQALAAALPTAVGTGLRPTPPGTESGSWNEAAASPQQREFAVQLAVTGPSLPAGSLLLSVPGVCTAVGDSDRIDVTMVVAADSERLAVRACGIILNTHLDSTSIVQALAAVDYSRDVLEVLDEAGVPVDGALADFDQEWSVNAVLDRVATAA